MISGDWLTAAPTQAVFGMLEEAGHTGLAVGGCVRNALIRRPVEDVDIATDAHPETVIRLAEAAGLKPVPTGVAHGTVTVVAEGRGFEVTTFRADVETDGRHAVVRFSDTIEEDAARRDFTMNALYADRHGRVVDPLGGLPDLRAGRVRFIGMPRDRIREDYLRILRFFRFFAWYGDPEAGLDPDALDAVARNLDGLARLSRERVGAELRKLFAAPDPAMAAAGMARTGALAAVLPGADPAPLGPLVAWEGRLGLGPDAPRRMAALGCDGSEDLRFSKADARRLALLRETVESTAGPGELAWRHGDRTARDAVALRAALLGTEPPSDLDARIAEGAAAVFPVAARDLMPRWTGRALGHKLAELERAWIASGFRATRDDLLE